MAEKQPHIHVSRRGLHFEDVINEQNKRLPPVFGYQEKPVVSLEEALKPFAADHSHLARMVSSTKESIKKLIGNLPLDQIASIKIYTMEWDPHEKTLFFLVNSALRSEQRSNLRPWFSYLRLVMVALEKLPSITCQAYRGIRQHVTIPYNLNDVIIWWGFSSCSVARSVIEDGQFMGSTGPRTLFIIQCYQAKDIHEYSFYPIEKEVILLPGTQLRVVRTNRSTDLHIIELEEIASTEPPIKVPTRDENYNNKPLEKWIATCEPPEIVVLHQRALNDQDMWILSKLVLDTNKCTELRLSKHRGITAAGIAVLASSLQRNTALTALHLTHNSRSFSDASAAVLAEGLKHNRTLRVLDLSHNYIGNDGAEHLATMLQFNSTLTDLTLTDNQIHNQGIDSLMETLIQRNNTLRALSIDWNPFGDGCVSSLIDMLKNNKSLRLCVLDSSSLSREATVRLQEAGKTRIQ